MDWKRVLRIVVCLVLVCTLMIGISPLRADAFVVEATTVSAVGLTLYLYLLWSGFVVPPPDIGIYQDLDDSFRHYLDDLGIDESSWASDADDLDDEWESSDSSDGEDPGSSGSKTINVGQTLRNLMRAFVCGGLVKASIDLLPDVDAPQTGWSYYGDYLIPTLPDIDGYPYMAITRYKDRKFVVTYSDKPLIWNNSFSCMFHPDGTAFLYQLHITDAQIAAWDTYSSYTIPSPFENSSSISYTGETFVWANYDIVTNGNPVTLKYAGSDSISDENKYLVPSAILGSIAGGIQNGTLAEGDVNLPPILDVSSVIKSGMANYHEGMVQAAQDLIDGKISHEDFQEQLVYEDNSGEDIPGINDPVVNPDDPGGENEQIPTDGTLANFPVLNFFARLGQLLQDIMDGNLLGVKNFFEPWLSGLRKDLSGISSITESGFQDVIENGQNIIDSMKDIIDFNEVQDQINQEIQQEQNNLIDQGFSSISNAVIGAAQAAFVPSDGFLEGKINDLCDEYAFADSIAKTGKDLKLFFMTLGSKPPIIYIDLGAARYPHDIGSKTVFVDLTWYAEYKPTMDSILSAFMWLWFVWRILLSLPGIIQGTSGFWAPPDPLIGFSPWQAPFSRLDSGPTLRLGTSNYHSKGTDGKHYTKHEGL